MNESTVGLISKEVEGLMRRFSESAQNTSDIGDEISRRHVVLDYSRVAARFYEDQIVRLRGEVEKYRAQVRGPVAQLSNLDLTFTATEGVLLSSEFRAKMGTPSEEADYTPEEL